MSSNLLTRRERCRACLGLRLEKVLSLGKTPAANAFLKKEDLNKPEHYFPLEVYFCHDCSLLQLLDIVSPEFLFRNYVYISSFSPVFIKHFQSFADEVTSRYHLSKDSFVIDVGSNDGILLNPFQKYGIHVLGVDPAVKIAEQATREGVETVPEFLTPAVARAIVSKYGYADVVTGNNVFAHVDDLDGLVEAVKILLKPNGIFIVETPYLIDFLDKYLFDTVYHEHVSYYTVHPLTVLFKRLGMNVFDVQKVSSHGGSLRVFIQKDDGGHPLEAAVSEYTVHEKERKLNQVETYHEFAKKVKHNKAKLTTLLASFKEQGARIVGYGAAAKGNTLLNYFGIGNDILDYIVDDSEWKQGLYTPGTHIPVVARSELERKTPDYIILLAWNYADAIMKNLMNFHDQGGKFVIPVPDPHIV
ncbi:MAG TPA: class I SAM-dependent methyltransferase [Candidatus Paceibacterota bacterium]